MSEGGNYFEKILKINKKTLEIMRVMIYTIVELMCNLVSG